MNTKVEAIIARMRPKNYLEAELFQLAPLPLDEENYPDGFTMQIRSGAGTSTKWLTISAAQQKLIEQVLLKVPKEHLTEL
jgi:hypothetical protein